MRASTGAVIVSVVIGLVFGLGLRSLPGATVARAAAGASTVATPAQALPVAYSQGPGAGQDLVAAEMSNGQAPVLVSCGAGQQTLVRQIWLNGQPTSQVECVQGASAGVVYPSARMRTVANPQVVYGETGPEPRVTEAVYRQAPLAEDRARKRRVERGRSGDRRDHRRQEGRLDRCRDRRRRVLAVRSDQETLAGIAPGEGGAGVPPARRAGRAGRQAGTPAPPGSRCPAGGSPRRSSVGQASRLPVAQARGRRRQDRAEGRNVAGSLTRPEAGSREPPEPTAA
jgi:hypothetical protein